MGVDLLWNAAVIYGELNNVGYSILLGRKKQMYQLDICFTYESFYHLAGLQHLPDITYPSKNKERIYKDKMCIRDRSGAGDCLCCRGQGDSFS